MSAESKSSLPTADAGKGRGLAALWLPVLLMAAVHLGGLARGDWMVLKGGLFGPDAYMRLVRVRQLVDSGDWFQSVLSRSNTPFGEVQHWTRPFDLLLLAGAGVLQPFLDFEAALYWWGVALSPVLHLVMLLVLFWAVRPLLDREGQTYFGLLFLFQLSVVAQFLPGRPDHHSLQLLMFVLLLGFAVRLLTSGSGSRLAVLAALPAGLAIWTGVEGLVAASVVVLGLALAWLFIGSAYARKSVSFSAGLAAFLLIAVLAERPTEDWLAEEYDRVSVVHVWLVLLVAAYWLAISLIEARGCWGGNLSQRGLGAVVGAVFVGAVFVGAVFVGLGLWLIYPKFFHGPLVDVDPEVIEIWGRNIAEVVSPIDQASLGEAAYLTLFFLGSALVAAPYLAYLAWRTSGEIRQAWLLLALALAIYLPLALYQLRWSSYAQLIGLPAFTVLLLHTLSVLRLKTSPSIVGGGRSAWTRLLGIAFGRTVVVLAFCGGLIGLAVAVRPLQAGDDGKGGVSHPSCDVPAMARHLSESPNYRARPQRLMSFIFDGPELLYRTSHQVVGTPYHRNRDGILDTIAFFSATDLALARELVRKRKLDLVLVCPAQAERLLYLGQDRDITLFERLRDREAPVWLQSVDLPTGLASQYLLFEVVG